MVKVTHEGSVVHFDINTNLSLRQNVREISTGFGISYSSDLVLRRVDFEGTGLETINSLEGLADALRDNSSLVLCLAPNSMALKILSSLESNSQKIKDGDFLSLLRNLKDCEFYKEFLLRNGFLKLQQCVVNLEPPQLLYALVAIQTLIDNPEYNEYPSSVATLSPEFINAVMSVIKHTQNSSLLQVAAAIIIKLLAIETARKGAIHKRTFVFKLVGLYMESEPGFVTSLLDRLTPNANNSPFQVSSISLINALYEVVVSRGNNKDRHIFTDTDTLTIRKSLVSLVQQLSSDLNSSEHDELQKLVIEFQGLLVKEWNLQRRQPVIVTRGSTHEDLLIEIWNAAGLDRIDANHIYKWRKLGFGTDVPRKEFSRVGLFGLKMMRFFAVSQADYFSRFVQEQSVKQAEKRCPFAKACIEVLEILLDFWEISTGYSTATSFQPLLLDFERVLNASLRLYFRLWLEMEAQNTTDDIARVAATVRSHFKACATRAEIEFAANSFNFFERGLLSTPYNIIRERQLKELSNDDELLAKMPFKHLREKLYKANYEFVKEQRIGCLIRGAWFPVFNEKGQAKSVIRYYRLNPNRLQLHYGEFKEPGSAPSLSVLPNKIEISQITEILTGMSSPIFKDHTKKPKSPVSASPAKTPSLTFSIVTSERFGSGSPTGVSITSSSNNSNNNKNNSNNNATTSLSDFVCQSAMQYSEWIDGFNFLLGKNISTRETATLVLQLTEQELRLGLLDVTASKGTIEIGVEGIGCLELPEAVEFYYDMDPGVGGGRNHFAGDIFENRKSDSRVYESDDDHEKVGDQAN